MPDAPHQPETIPGWDHPEEWAAPALSPEHAMDAAAPPIDPDQPAARDLRVTLAMSIVNASQQIGPDGEAMTAQQVGERVLEALLGDDRGACLMLDEGPDIEIDLAAVVAATWVDPPEPGPQFWRTLMQDSAPPLRIVVDPGAVRAQRLTGATLLRGDQRIVLDLPALIWVASATGHLLAAAGITLDAGG
jgi:hypothetical protein